MAGVIVGTHCWATVVSDDVSARMTLVMVPEKYLWNASVLQRVHLFSLVNKLLWCSNKLPSFITWWLAVRQETVNVAGGLEKIENSCLRWETS